MCTLNTEGYKYGCGHYIIARKLAKNDCGSRNCLNSTCHRTPCYDCMCDRYFGPDASEKILAVKPEFCPECSPHFPPAPKRPSASNRRW